MVTIQRGPNGTFGLVYDGNKITFLKVGGSAEKFKEIEIGDEIIFINGSYVGENTSTTQITSLIGRSQGSVTLIMQRGSIV